MRTHHPTRDWNQMIIKTFPLNIKKQEDLEALEKLPKGKRSFLIIQAIHRLADEIDKEDNANKRK